MGRIQERLPEGGSRGILAAGILGILGFCVIFYFVVTGGSAAFDLKGEAFFCGLRRDFLTPVVKGITYMGNWQTVTALCLALLIIKPLRIDWGIPVSAGAIFVTLLNKTLKHMVQRPRPQEVVHLINEGGFSFPSGHSITSMFVYGLLIYLVRTNVKNKTAANILTAALSFLAVCVGMSRVYLGVHYPTDVLAGWCLGIAVMTAMICALKTIKLKKKRISK